MRGMALDLLSSVLESSPEPLASSFKRKYTPCRARDSRVSSSIGTVPWLRHIRAQQTRTSLYLYIRILHLYIYIYIHMYSFVLHMLF